MCPSHFVIFLQGKAKTKKPCTRPVPFNLSQPKSTRITSVNQKPRVFPQSRAHAVHLEKNARNTHPKTKSINAKPSHPPAVLNSNGGSTKVQHQSQGEATENTLQLSGQPVPYETFKTSTILSNPLSSFPDNAVHQRGAPSSARPDSAQSCLAHMDLLTLKEPSKNSEARQNVQTTTHGNFSKGSTGNFSVVLTLFMQSVTCSNITVLSCITLCAVHNSTCTLLKISTPSVPLIHFYWEGISVFSLYIFFDACLTLAYLQCSSSLLLHIARTVSCHRCSVVTLTAFLS